LLKDKSTWCKVIEFSNRVHACLKEDTEGKEVRIWIRRINGFFGLVVMTEDNPANP